MSVEKRVTRDEHGNVVLVVKVIGFSDAMRFAWALQHLQCDFIGVGARAMRSIRRLVGPAAHDAACNQLGIPKGRARTGRHR